MFLTLVASPHNGHVWVYINYTCTYTILAVKGTCVHVQVYTLYLYQYTIVEGLRARVV